MRFFGTYAPVAMAAMAAFFAAPTAFVAGPAGDLVIASTTWPLWGGSVAFAQSQPPRPGERGPVIFELNRNGKLTPVKGQRKSRASQSPRARQREGSSAAKKDAGFCRQKDILAVVEANRSRTQRCYRRRLREQPDLGTITVRLSWRIGLDGRVTRVTTESSDRPDAALEQCLEKTVAKWRFSKPERGGMCQIKFPFVFGRERQQSKPAK